MAQGPEEAQRDPRPEAAGSSEGATSVADLRPEGAEVPAAAPEEEPGPTDRTVGTGSFFALSCSVGALAVIVGGILVFLFTRVF